MCHYSLVHLKSPVEYLVLACINSYTCIYNTVYYKCMHLHNNVDYDLHTSSYSIIELVLVNAGTCICEGVSESEGLL